MNKAKVWFTIFALLLTGVIPAQSQSIAYGNKIADLREGLVKALAERFVPGRDGAIGRNRGGYFHVRFQLGMHNLANYGIVNQAPRALQMFLDSVSYSFRHQLDSGCFALSIPPDLANKVSPRHGDEVSGVAFFASSLGTGWYAVETSDWAQASARVKAIRERLSEFKPNLRLTLDYLMQNRTVLHQVDRFAPNRLLFNAVAFCTLGRILDNDAAIQAATTFVSAATNQVDMAGYFIEAGGYDSSYNGVATALALRLLLMGYDSEKLSQVCADAMRWQISRIDSKGKISTDGNTRVAPGEYGESFLGRKKDVDAGHTIEALMLYSLYFSDMEYAKRAADVLRYYRADKGH